MRLSVYSAEEREKGLSKNLYEGINGCCAGVTCCTDDAYGEPAAHADQEGFYVLEGSGFALIDGEEIRIAPNTAFLLPPGVYHTFRRDGGTERLVLFWHHGAV